MAIVQSHMSCVHPFVPLLRPRSNPNPEPHLVQFEITCLVSVLLFPVHCPSSSVPPLQMEVIRDNFATALELFRTAITAPSCQFVAVDCEFTGHKTSNTHSTEDEEEEEEEEEEEGGGGGGEGGRSRSWLSDWFFSGLHPTSSAQQLGRYDTPQQRYEQARASAMAFVPIQIGNNILCCYVLLCYVKRVVNSLILWHQATMLYHSHLSCHVMSCHVHVLGICIFSTDDSADTKETKLIAHP